MPMALMIFLLCMWQLYLTMRNMTSVEHAEARYAYINDKFISQVQLVLHTGGGGNECELHERSNWKRNREQNRGR